MKVYLGEDLGTDKPVKSMYWPIDIELKGEVIEYVPFYVSDQVGKPTTYCGYVAYLEKTTDSNAHYLVKPMNPMLLSDYKVMDALRYLNKDNDKYAIYNTFAIKREIIKSITYYESRPRDRKVKHWKYDRYNGSIIRVNHHSGLGCNICVCSSVEEIEKIFKKKVTVVKNKEESGEMI